MGFLKKLGEQAASMTTPQSPEQVAAQQRSLGIDTANFGGPSNAPVAADDPILQPIEGISMEIYATIAKKCSNLGVTDEAGMAEVAQQNGLDPEVFGRAVKEWTARMGQNMAVGQEFRKFYDVAT